MFKQCITTSQSPEEMEEREATRDINKLLPPIIVLKAEAVLRDCSVKTSTKDTLDANLQSFLEEKQ